MTPRAPEEKNRGRRSIRLDGIEAAVEVHRVLGPGFLESIDEQALAVELDIRDVSFARQVPFGLDDKGHPLGEARVDLLVGRKLVVELKVVPQLAPIHLAQVLSYRKAMGAPQGPGPAGAHLGLLITFNVPQLRRGVAA